MAKLRKGILIIIWSLLAVLVLASAVELALMWKSERDSYIEAEGTLEEAHKNEIFTENPMRVIDIKVREGDRVQREQLLATVEADDYSIQLKKALVNLEQTKLDLEKFKEGIQEKERALSKAEEAVRTAERELDSTRILCGEGAVSSKELELAKARFNAAVNSMEDAKGALRLANIELKNMENRVKLAELGVQEAEEKIEKNSPYIISPEDGIVTAVNAKEGRFTDPSEPVFVISDLSNLQIKLNINAEDVSRIELGQEVEITTDAAENETYRGIVDSISPMAKVKQADYYTEAFVEVIVKVIDRYRLFMPGFPVKAKILSDAWSHEVNIAETSILPDRDTAYVFGRTGDQIWTVYTDRQGENPPQVYLTVNSASTEEVIGSLQISSSTGAKSNPKIIQVGMDDYFVCWETEGKTQKYIEYTVVDSNLEFDRPKPITSDKFDLTNPSVFTSAEGKKYLSVVRKTTRDFGFYLYEINNNGANLAIDTGTVLVDESVNLGFRDLTPSILDVFCGKTPEGFVFAWVEKKSDYAYFNFIKLDNGNTLLVPKTEVFRYYIPTPYRNNFSVEFLPSAMHVFWTEINNPIDKFYQLSRQEIGYTGNPIGQKEILTTPDADFRGAVSTAVDDDNNIHVVWVDQERNSKRLNSDIYYQQLDSEGISLTQPKTIVGKMNTQKFPDIFISPDGERVVTWIDLKEDGYKLLFKSTNPALVAKLKKDNLIPDFGKRVTGHILNLFTSLASAVLFLIPYNLLPILLFCFFLFQVVFKGRKKPAYYLLFLLLVLPVKYFNGLVFKSIFTEMANVTNEVLFVINATTFVLLAVVTYIQFSRPGKNSRLDTFSYLFAGWLYLDTVCVLVASFLGTFRGGF